PVRDRRGSRSPGRRDEADRGQRSGVARASAPAPRGGAPRREPRAQPPAPRIGGRAARPRRHVGEAAMKIGERFYQNFELRVDVASDPEDTPFVVDLETAQVPPIEPAADEAEQAAQELAAAAAAMTQASPLAAAEPREPVPTPLELAVIALL